MTANESPPTWWRTASWVTWKPGSSVIFRQHPETDGRFMVILKQPITFLRAGLGCNLKKNSNRSRLFLVPSASKTLIKTSCLGFKLREKSVYVFRLSFGSAYGMRSGPNAVCFHVEARLLIGSRWVLLNKSGALTLKAKVNILSSFTRPLWC